MKFDKNNLVLYVVTDDNRNGKLSLSKRVGEALEGGATTIQLREKNLDEESFVKEAFEIKELCKKYNVPFIVNDNVGVAVKVNSDGVHIGQKDMKVSSARSLIGKDKILGVSAQTVEQAVLAEKEGADYLGVGAVFSTSSKDDADNVDIETLKQICKSVNIPVVAIGGIDADNVAKLKGSGICGVAVISAVFSKENIRKATTELKKKTEQVIFGD